MDHKDAVREGYSRSAPVYDQTAGATYLKALWRLMPRINVAPQPAILDVGCGTGLNILEAARVLGPCKKLVGIDLSPGMIEVARRKASAAGVPATFLVGDAESLPVDDQGFDLVICNSVYHWFADRGHTIAEMKRALKPGGQLVITCVANPGFFEWIRLVDDVHVRLFGEKRAWMPALPTPPELLGHLYGAGLAVEHLSYEVDAMPVQDVPAFLQTMSVIAPTWIAGLTDDQRDALIKTLTELMVTRYRTGLVVTTAGMGGVARRPRLKS